MDRHLGFRPRFASVETADYQVVLGVVAAGLGIALVPSMAIVHAQRDDIVSIPLTGRTIHRRVEAAIPADGAVPRVTRALINTLIAQYKSNASMRPAS